MNHWEQFWKDVIEFIEEDYGQGHPAKWKQTVIQDFLIYQQEVVASLLEKNDVLKEVYTLQNWGTVSPGTFRQIFIKNKSNGNKTTRNGFALYMGYRTAEHYLAVKRETRNTAASNYQKQRLSNRRREDAVPVSIQLPNADFEKEDKNDHWMLYEVAFLWHGKEPPSIQAHFYQMTREMEQTKASLHKAVELGLLKAETKKFPNGVTRFVTRKDLEEFVDKQNLEKPSFLNTNLRKSIDEK